MTDDLRKWSAYSPIDPLWDFPPARSALDAKIQAEIIVLRYRDHHAFQGNATYNELSKLAEAIRNIQCSSLTSAAPSSPTPATS